MVTPKARVSRTQVGDSPAAPCLLVGNLQILGTAGGGSLNIRLSALIEKLTKNLDSLRMKARISARDALALLAKEFSCNQGSCVENMFTVVKHLIIR